MRVTIPVTLDIGDPPTPAAAALQRGRLFAAGVGVLMVYGGAKAGGFWGFTLSAIGIGTTWKKGREYLAGRNVVQIAATTASQSLPPENLPASAPAA